MQNNLSELWFKSMMFLYSLYFDPVEANGFVVIGRLQWLCCEPVQVYMLCVNTVWPLTCWMQAPTGDFILVFVGHVSQTVTSLYTCLHDYRRELGRISFNLYLVVCWNALCDKTYHKSSVI